MRYHQARRCMHRIEVLITTGAWMHSLQQNNDHCFAIQMWQTYARKSIIDLLDTEPENPHWYNMYLLAKPLKFTLAIPRRMSTNSESTIGRK